MLFLVSQIIYSLIIYIFTYPFRNQETAECDRIVQQHNQTQSNKQTSLFGKIFIELLKLTLWASRAAPEYLPDRNASSQKTCTWMFVTAL